MIEIVGSFKNEKIKFTFGESIPELLSIGGDQKYVYMPFGFYKVKKCKRSQTKGNVIGVDALCYNNGSIELILNRLGTKSFYEGAVKKEEQVGKAEPSKTNTNWNKPTPKINLFLRKIYARRENSKRYHDGDKNNSCQLDLLMLLFNELMKKNLSWAEKRLAEIHVAYKNKIKTNLGSKIEDIKNEDLINLIAHNKANLIIVCQP
eukprot:XP_002258728.1 hypothetical protein, conserved in Plasmodium species [Plasmodium knowlesi strain H]